MSIILTLALLSSTALPPKAMQDAIKSKLSAELLDGISAQYRWLPDEGGVFYCGFVNGKNSYGAYTGFRPFMVVGANTGRGYRAEDVVLDVDPSGTYARKWAAEECIKAGYDISRVPD